MALSDILAAMEAEADAERRRITAQAEASVAQINAAAEAEAAAIRERHQRETQAPQRDEAARRLNRARLSAQRALNRARDDLFVEAVARAQVRLSDLRRQPNYGLVLRALAAEAVKQLDGEIVMRTDARDEAILRAAYPGARIELTLETWGGIEARAPDSTIVVTNTLEARLAQAQQILRQAVMPLIEPHTPEGELGPARAGPAADRAWLEPVR